MVILSLQTKLPSPPLGATLPMGSAKFSPIPKKGKDHRGPPSDPSIPVSHQAPKPPNAPSARSLARARARIPATPVPRAVRVPSAPPSPGPAAGAASAEVPHSYPRPITEQQKRSRKGPQKGTTQPGSMADVDYEDVVVEERPDGDRVDEAGDGPVVDNFPCTADTAGRYASEGWTVVGGREDLTPSGEQILEHEASCLATDCVNRRRAAARRAAAVRRTAADDKKRHAGEASIRAALAAKEDARRASPSASIPQKSRRILASQKLVEALAQLQVLAPAVGEDIPAPTPAAKSRKHAAQRVTRASGASILTTPAATSAATTTPAATSAATITPAATIAATTTLAAKRTAATTPAAKRTAATTPAATTAATTTPTPAEITATTGSILKEMRIVDKQIEIREALHWSQRVNAAKKTCRVWKTIWARGIAAMKAFAESFKNFVPSNVKSPRTAMRAPTVAGRRKKARVAQGAACSPSWSHVAKIKRIWSAATGSIGAVYNVFLKRHLAGQAQRHHRRVCSVAPSGTPSTTQRRRLACLFRCLLAPSEQQRGKPFSCNSDGDGPPRGAPGTNSLVNQAGVCPVDSCSRRPHQEADGYIQECCGRSHHQYWQALQGKVKCARHDCVLPVNFDVEHQQAYDYCSIEHARSSAEYQSYLSLPQAADGKKSCRNCERVCRPGPDPHGNPWVFCGRTCSTSYYTHAGSEPPPSPLASPAEEEPLDTSMIEETPSVASDLQQGVARKQRWRSLTPAEEAATLQHVKEPLSNNAGQGGSLVVVEEEPSDKSLVDETPTAAGDHKQNVARKRSLETR